LPARSRKTPRRSGLRASRSIKAAEAHRASSGA
jgi:hypothetical protein